MSERFTVRFWGVRGSIAVPGPDTVRYGGNTACVEVRCGDRVVVFDAGTGLRPLGIALQREAPLDLDVFLSHSHYDHICGVPFFAPVFDPRNRVRFWAGHLADDKTLHSVVRAMMTEPYFPIPVETLRAECAFAEFTCGDTLEFQPGLTMRTAPLRHPNEAVGYRLEFAGRALCYVTDIEHAPGGRDDSLLDLVRGADVMIYDSSYSDAEYPQRVGWGHSTWQECLRVAEAAGVGRAVLFHHEPGRSDDEMDGIAAAAERMRPGSLAAREGLELEL